KYATLNNASKYSLVCNGRYTPKARALARTLACSGCSQRQISNVLNAVASTLGISIKHRMSQRTVQRVIIEGGVAADIQLGYEISQTQLNCDGTTKCHVNLESRHIALRVEPYSDAPDANPSTAHRVRLLGVDASVDHTSETQVRGWKRKADEVSQLYHESPFAERTQTSLSPDDLVLKLCGMNGDHMED
ncbi:predicted protein, partial [Postia placenta Mad-698-R]